MQLSHALQQVLVLLLRPRMSTGDVMWDSATLVLMSCLLELFFSHVSYLVQGHGAWKRFPSWYVRRETNVKVYEFIDGTRNKSFMSLQWFVYRECLHSLDCREFRTTRHEPHDVLVSRPRLRAKASRVRASFHLNKNTPALPKKN